MAIEAKSAQKRRRGAERPYAHLRATPDERMRILSGGRPFNAEAWQRGAVPPTPEELEDLEDFLREWKELRRDSLASGGVDAPERAA